MAGRARGGGSARRGALLAAGDRVCSAGGRGGEAVGPDATRPPERLSGDVIARGGAAVVANSRPGRLAFGCRGGGRHHRGRLLPMPRAWSSAWVDGLHGLSRTCVAAASSAPVQAGSAGGDHRRTG